MRLIDFEGIANPAAPHVAGITISTTALSLPAILTLHAATRFVEIVVEDADVRMTLSGTTPTSTIGRKLLQDVGRLMTRASADTCKLIRAGASDATIQVLQYIN